MPGKGEVIEITMQQAAQPFRHLFSFLDDIFQIFHLSHFKEVEDSLGVRRLGHSILRKARYGRQASLITYNSSLILFSTSQHLSFSASRRIRRVELAGLFKE
jgi:hypothetical protein